MNFLTIFFLLIKNVFYFLLIVVTTFLLLHEFHPLRIITRIKKSKITKADQDSAHLTKKGGERQTISYSLNYRMWKKNEEEDFQTKRSEYFSYVLRVSCFPSDNISKIPHACFFE